MFWEGLLMSGLAVGLSAASYMAGMRTANKYHAMIGNFKADKPQPERTGYERVPDAVSPIPVTWYEVKPHAEPPQIDLSSSGIMEKVQESGRGTVQIKKGASK